MSEDKDLFIVGILSLVVFEVWKIYEDNAPSLAICRAADSADERSDVRTQINDSDVMIGGATLAVAGVFAYHTKKANVFLLPAIILIGLSLYRRIVVNSTSTISPR